MFRERRAAWIRLQGIAAIAKRCVVKQPTALNPLLQHSVPRGRGLLASIQFCPLPHSPNFLGLGPHQLRGEQILRLHDESEHGAVPLLGFSLLCTATMPLSEPVPTHCNFSTSYCARLAFLFCIQAPVDSTRAVDEKFGRVPGYPLRLVLVLVVVRVSGNGLA
eukprot:1249494-Rhodomonas_salina.2